MDATGQAKARFLELLGPAHADSYPTCLESQFPHVFETILSLWGSHKMDDYFQELLVTSRPGRQGFPDEAATEILHLYRVYNALGLARPPIPTQGTGWDWVNRLEYFEAAGKE